MMDTDNNGGASGLVPNGDPDDAATTFDLLFDEALNNPGEPARGALPDGFAGLVRCAVQLEEGEGVVVLDAPADRLFDTITSALSERQWHVISREARRLGGDSSPLRYVMNVRRRETLEDSGQAPDA